MRCETADSLLSVSPSLRFRPRRFGKRRRADCVILGGMGALSGRCDPGDTVGNSGGRTRSRCFEMQPSAACSNSGHERAVFCPVSAAEGGIRQSHRHPTRDESLYRPLAKLLMGTRPNLHFH